uniref:Tectonin beta-propeller repeat-containing protein 1 n=1 Tax=Cyprinodon variegatus TaxID=28743 RepID=A0A3Q2GAX2_CYPVA
NQLFIYPTFGNEFMAGCRWNPVDGFSDRLLPSDRWQWSDISGLEHRPLDGFQLPSGSWEWEGDWHVDENHEGEPTEKDGWTYAMDFPATYTKDKKWNSCVRRRRWLRYRRYKAMDNWAKIPSQQTTLPDPFSDISCGGWEVSDEPRGRLSLWAISIQGKVWFREEISHHNPEGSAWVEVPVPGEVVQISCGPGDLVWAVLWEGQLLVREGIGRDCLKGTSWAVVESPNPEVGAIHVAVGMNVVWALTKDNKVWFRRGVDSHNPCGSGWISMVGEMIMINVGLNDQVWAIGCEDRAVYFRQGVTFSELSGKTWKAINVPRDGDRSHSSASANSLHSAGCFFSGEVRAPSVVSDTESDVENPPGDGAMSNVTFPNEDHFEVAPGDGEVDAVTSTQAGGPDPQWSNVDLEEAQIQHGQMGAVPDCADSCSLSSVATYTLTMEDQFGADEHPLWAWVSGGGCSVFNLCFFTCLPPAVLQSVQSMSLSVSPAQTAAWRKQIFQQLSERSKREMDDFKHYEQAIEKSVWVKKGAMQWWRDWKPHKWVDVHFALEQFSGADGNKDGILFVYYNYHDEKKYLHAFINEVTILVPVLNDSKHTFAVYTPERTKQRWPIRLAAATELEMYDWVCIQLNPQLNALFLTFYECNDVIKDKMFWRQVGGHLRLVECNSLGIVWGLGYDHTAWVYTGGYGGGFFQGLASSTDNVYTQTDIKSVYIYENQRWNPVTGYSNRGLPTDRYMWSDASGLHECTKTGTKPPSTHWTWVSDWVIDYSVSGGTDKEGWQYAADFPASYHGSKTMKDFVRRRRWSRKCKLTTTGPWQEVPPIALSDVTILPCAAQSSVDTVPLWAISNKGDILCRLGVTLLTPAGTSWLHVGTDQPFKSISISAGSQVWAIARDGSAFYRGSVSPQNPAGDCWYHIPTPAKQKLKQVSVGRTSVYAVDENGNLWYRQGVTPRYPQGSSWEHISNNVRKVSVGPLDQVWIIADKVQGSHSLSCGTVCHRLGVQPMEPKGQSWDYGIGGGWDHITVRGNSMEPPHICLSSRT